MKVAVTGANGQLGTDVCAEFRAAGHEVQEITHGMMDLSNADTTRELLVNSTPDVVVNTAAMHHVERCEADPASAFAVNALGARNLARLSNEIGFVLAHISTDYVFDGATHRPYTEHDTPHPLNVYGNSKLAGEHFVRSIAPRHFVMRSSALFGHAPCRAKGGLNFPQLMLKLARERGTVRVVNSEVVSPTYTVDLARALLNLVGTTQYGLYHAVSTNACSWFDFAAYVFELTATAATLQVAGADEFPAKVPRPAYSALDNLRLAKAGYVMPTWKDALERYLLPR